MILIRFQTENRTKLEEEKRKNADMIATTQQNETGNIDDLKNNEIQGSLQEFIKYLLEANQKQPNPDENNEYLINGRMRPRGLSS